MIFKLDVNFVRELSREKQNIDETGISDDENIFFKYEVRGTQYEVWPCIHHHFSDSCNPVLYQKLMLPYNPFPTEYLTFKKINLCSDSSPSACYS